MRWSDALIVGGASGDVFAYDLADACKLARTLYPDPPVCVPRFPPAVRLAGVHADSVTAAVWIPSFEAKVFGGGGLLATSSLDKTIAICDLDSRQVVARLGGQGKPVRALTHLPAVEALASCGQEHLISLWPSADFGEGGIVARPLGVLRGHSTPVNKLVAVADGTQLLSLGADGSLRLWDVRMRHCIQLLNEPSRSRHDYARGVSEVSSLEMTCVALDERSGGLVTAGSVPALWAVRKAARGEQREPRALDTPSLAVYNATFGVVVCTDGAYALAVWRVETGQCLGRFERAHGTAKVSALCFDCTGRRLLSGGRDGSVRVWNFSSGECLRACVGPTTDQLEVTGVLHVPPASARPGYFVSVGWSRALSCFPDLPMRTGVRARSSRAAPRGCRACCRLPCAASLCARAHAPFTPASACPAPAPAPA